jgi:hypothetical protein
MSPARSSGATRSARWLAACGALAAIVISGGVARADRIGDASPPATPVGLQPVVAPHGVIVVAGSDDATAAARALAFDVYRDASLRPAIDDATARVLAGDAPDASASAKIQDLAEARASAAKAPGDAAARRLFASIGVELHAELVVVVTLDGGRPIARALKPTSTAFERVEMGASIERGVAPSGPNAPSVGDVVTWPGARLLLKGLLTAPIVKVAATAPATAPVVPEAQERPMWKSPWFWASLGGVAAVGVTVFALSKAGGDSGTVHLNGHVGP